jgi:ABC-type multidrug transport system ATPase subunit
MQISLINTGKRFNREWIFRHVDYEFTGTKKYAITGSNGSGKSTLLQVIAGALTHNEGKVRMAVNNTIVAEENMHQQLAIAAPYLELIEEMTAKEFLAFHHRFKPLKLSVTEALSKVQLENAANKQIRYYSSGMKQRLKLAQAFFCHTPVLLLDEPTTNLDAEGIALYKSLVKNYAGDKLTLISSNDPQEYNFCDEVIEVAKYKGNF